MRNKIKFSKTMFEKQLIRKSISDKGCWIWTGKRDSFGYGLFGKKIKRAHRVSWEYHNGSIPHKKFICHKCDNPPCFNPNHLFIGTAKTNAIDKELKNRHPRTSNWGTKSKTNKLSIKDVIKARELYKLGCSFIDISKNTNVCSSTIRRAILGISWKIIQ